MLYIYIHIRPQNFKFHGRKQRFHNKQAQGPYFENGFCKEVVVSSNPQSLQINLSPRPSPQAEQLYNHYFNHKRRAHCFQLHIWKKIFRILKKHPIPKDRWHIYLTKYFFTEIRYLHKMFMVKNLLKNLVVKL